MIDTCRTYVPYCVSSKLEGVAYKQNLLGIADNVSTKVARGKTHHEAGALMQEGVAVSWPTTRRSHYHYQPHSAPVIITFTLHLTLAYLRAWREPSQASFSRQSVASFPVHNIRCEQELGGL